MKPNYQHITYLENQLPILNQIQSIACLFDLSRQYHSVDGKKSITYAQRALQLAHQLSNTPQIIQAYYHLAQAYYRSKQYSAAIQHFLEAQNLAKNTQNHVLLAHITQELGQAYQCQQYRKQAVIQYQAALSLFQQSAQNSKVADTHCLLARFYEQQESTTQALEHHKAALQLYQQLNHTYKFTETAHKIAQNYQQLQQWNKVIKQLLDTIEEVQQNNYIDILAKYYQSLAQAYIAQDNFKKAYHFQYLHSQVQLEIGTEKEVNLKEAYQAKVHYINDLNNTKTKHILEDLQQTQSRLNYIEKMAALGQLAAGIAYEANNPINFITGNMGALQRNVEFLLKIIEKYNNEESPQKIASFKEKIDFEYTRQETFKIIDAISKGANRTAHIVESLQHFSRTNEAVKVQIDVHQFINIHLAQLKNLLINRVRIMSTFGNIPKISCYPNKLSQVFMSLLHIATESLPTCQPINILLNTYQINPNSIQIIIKATTVQTSLSLNSLSENNAQIPSNNIINLDKCLQIIKEHSGELHILQNPSKQNQFTIQLPTHQP